MMIELFLSLVLVHLVADFVLQTGKTCKDKKERHWKSPHHYVHALIVFGLAWLFSWDICFWWAALIIGVVHLGLSYLGMNLVLKYTIIFKSKGKGTWSKPTTT